MIFTQPCLNKLLQSQAEICVLVVNAKKGSPKLSINHSQTELLLIGRCFKLTSSQCIFERRTVTSPTTLVSKGRHSLGLVVGLRIPFIVPVWHFLSFSFRGTYFHIRTENCWCQNFCENYALCNSKNDLADFVQLIPKIWLRINFINKLMANYFWTLIRSPSILHVNYIVRQ